MSISTIDTEKFKTDIYLTEDPDGSLKVTPTGDIATSTGKDNLYSSLRRRVMTSRGELVHRPQYGAGVQNFVGRLNSVTERSRLASEIKTNLFRDSRISDLSVAVGLGRPSTPTAFGSVSISLSIKTVGNDKPDTININYSE